MKKKKLLCLLLMTICLIGATLPMSVSAAELASGTCGGLILVLVGVILCCGRKKTGRSN